MKNRVREIMKMRGMTIQRLADKSDVSRRTVQNVVKGIDSCHLETMDKIAEALQVSLAELFLEPYEKIVHYEFALPAAMEFAEEHGIYGVNGREAAATNPSVDKLAEAALECFQVLPQEVQRKFFELYCEKGQPSRR